MTLLRKTVLLLAVNFLVSVPVFSQLNIDSVYRNSIKINMATFIFQNVSMLYERQINDHWSLQLGGSFKWGGNIPKAAGFGNFIVASETTCLRGFSITPEARYYFRKSECYGTVNGLYTGLYSRLNRLNSDLQFYIWDGTGYVDAGGSESFRELGIGIQVGYQFTI